MSEETKSVASETVSEQPTQETPASSPDVGALIAESKKYRTRAQDAEARIAEMEKTLAKAEETKLKEKEDFKALYEKVSSENEALSSVADKWTKYEETRRASLLEKHPEEDRESLQGLPLDTLEFVTNKIASAKANAPQVAGNARQEIPSEPVDWANKESLKKNWATIIANAQKKN
jgi:hypothetical protein